MDAPDDAEQCPRPSQLRVEFEAEPGNVDPTRPPRFGWRMETERRGARQAAFRVVVARDSEAAAAGRGTVWDSGRVDSRRAAVTYDGPDLAADETYHWSVRCWTDEGATYWAGPATFTTALAPEDWRGEWIAHQPGTGDSNGWRSRWRDPDAGDRPWVQVDLGESRPIERVDLHPAEPIDVVRTPDDVAVTTSWGADPVAEFGFPDAYRIEVAEDPAFEQPTVVAEVEDGEVDSDEADGTDSAADSDDADDSEEDITADDELTGTVTTRIHDAGDATGRYVRVVATDPWEVDAAAARAPEDEADARLVERSNPWQCFALAGLSVRGRDGTDLAAERPVAASSAVETDTWGPEHLTNGHDASHRASSSPQLRTEFTLDRPVESARIHVAAVGYGELSVNGERVGDRRLDPAWTEYERRVLYASHDVTDRLEAGENAIGCWLGCGWFAKRSAYWLADGSPRVRATLTVEFADGSTRRLSTGPDWRARESPLRENDLYDGERYDARLEADGWNEPGPDDGGWNVATVVDAPGGTLQPERIEPMRVVEEVDVQAVHEHPDGPILDFGQNLTGWLAVDLDDPDGGDELQLRHAETLTEDGDLSTADLRSADATDTYVARGAAVEAYEPRFTYHGFRYAQLSGSALADSGAAEEPATADGPGTTADLDPADSPTVEPGAVTAKVVHTAMDRRGYFECSNQDLNQVQHNAVWGLRGNAHSIPEDCPQRDERFGWTGDAQIAARSLLFNFDAVRFHEKWARDHDDAQSPMGFVPDVIPSKDPEDPADPTWSITRVMVPWYLYRHDGDERVLREQYEGMRAYVDYWLSVADEDGVVPATYGKFGDWLAFENTDGRRGLPFELFTTAFVYQVTDTLAKVAAVLGERADADRYRDRATAIAAGFNQRFFDAERGVYGPGTQSSFAVPLFLGLVPEDRVDDVVANLAETVRSDGSKLRTGFLGTRPLLHTLASHGHADLAYEVVAQPERPGWVYMARKGATTMWERWDSDDRVGSGMNSLNHSPFTHVSEFFYEVLAGIRVGDRPVTEHVTVDPAIVDDLEWVEASLETRNGELAVDWERRGGERDEPGGYELSVTVPWNGTATVRLPRAADATVSESGVDLADRGELAGLQSVERDGDALVVVVGAGAYEFAVE